MDEDGSINLYGFLLNNAVNRFDPFGLTDEPTLAPIPDDQRQCCDQKTVEAGEKQLNANYQKASQALAAQGFKPVEIGEKGASCKNSSGDILSEWLLPTPKCWKCTLEVRNHFADLLGQDHQVVICRSFPKDGPSKEVIFDWWGDTTHATHESGGPPDAFRKRWPYVNDKKSPDNVFYTQCSNGQPARPHTAHHTFNACRE
jgi:hypothetical protein